jgi:transcriptional regulator with XRE-family HTH domain
MHKKITVKGVIDINNIVLERIINLINAKGISDKQFLQAIGLNLTAMSDWKKGRNKSYLKHINKISDYLGVSVDYLLGKTDKPTLDDELEGVALALAGEIHDLTDAEKQDILDYIRFKKSQKEKK